MARSGEWFTGDNALDLDEYLTDFSSYSYPVGRVVHARCTKCGGTTFGLWLDDAEGCARRMCLGCGALVFMLDSAGYADDADLEDAACPCGGQNFELAAGFALREDGDVRWVYVAARCVRDGVLGVYADWKMATSPTEQLFRQV